MTFAIITGAHLLPYAWFYKTLWFAIFAGIIAVGVLILALLVPVHDMYGVALLTSGLLIVLTLLLYFDSRKKQRTIEFG